ncbi:MAG TPA: phospholipase D-like domain-containing protein [Rugosimonospora sp.]|nr:phospholipase D-like domain-containing protein [Rugosimonospora sp.]
MHDRPLRRTLCAALVALATALTGVLAATGPATAAGPYTLLTQPDNGHATLYSLINSAASSIDLTMYELNDTTAEQDLAAAAARGVTVRVILDGKHTSLNSAAYSYLTGNGVGVVYSSSTYYYTHQKTMVVDGTTSVIMSENWTPTYYSADRNFDLIEKDSADATAIEKVFNADYAGTSVTPSDADDLVWSPTDAQSRLLSLINGASTSLTLYALELGSTPIVNALVSAADRGVTVEVVAEYSSSYASNYNAVTAAGGSIVTYGTSDSLYIHAKAIVADYGTSSAKVYIGSQNFSSTSLNSNRELGLIITDSSVIASVNATLATDFANGTPW